MKRLSRIGVGHSFAWIKINEGCNYMYRGSNARDKQFDIVKNDKAKDGELWFNSSNESTEFRQVVIPLPLISDFSLKFTKYPSVVNSMGRQAYPFNLCIRNIKIVPSD